MRVIGLDLSLTGTGLSDGVSTWLVSSKGVAAATYDDRSARLRKLHDAITTSVLPADVVVVEGPALGSKTGSVWDRAGLWWAVYQTLTTKTEAVIVVPPTSLKLYATGSGKAAKPQMLEAAIRRMPDVDCGANDNRVDALWLALLGHDLMGQSLLELPAVHRKALAKIVGEG